MSWTRTAPRWSPSSGKLATLHKIACVSRSALIGQQYVAWFGVCFHSHEVNPTRPHREAISSGSAEEVPFIEQAQAALEVCMGGWLRRYKPVPLQGMVCSLLATSCCPHSRATLSIAGARCGPSG